jgi:hypothetical protein
MRNQRAGQAMFIPLDTIQVKLINDKFFSFAKGARLAVDVAQQLLIELYIMRVETPWCATRWKLRDMCVTKKDKR